MTRPTEGECRYFDADVTRWSLRRFVQSARVVRTFQTVRLFETMTVRQNIAVAAGARIEHERLALTVKAAAHTRAEDLIGSFELGSVADSIVTNLPYGTRRTVELARALATEPQVLLLDSGRWTDPGRARPAGTPHPLAHRRRDDDRPR